MEIRGDVPKSRGRALALAGIASFFAVWCGLSYTRLVPPLILPTPTEVLRAFPTLRFEEALVRSTGWSSSSYPWPTVLEHGVIGRHYAGRVTQVISGAIGLDDWEWGLDLFSDDAVVLKKVNYQMCFDEASAWYAEFGPIFVGQRLAASPLGSYLEGELPQPSA